MIQWFKKHPEFLQRESRELSNNSNYRERHQCRDQLFISYGDIIVRLDKAYRYPILIVYTDATPYRLPLVFPIKNNLEIEVIDQLAKLRIVDAYTEIKPHIRFYYDLRHQNSSGVLCILEEENLDYGSTYYSIASILARVRDWFAGHITGKYPPDSEELDYSSHFNFISKEIKIIYPEYFVDHELIEGDCYFSLFRIVPRRDLNSTIIVYYGVFIDGINKNGIIDQGIINLDFSFPHEKIKTSLDVVTNPEIINQLVNEGRILKAQWFFIGKEPTPFHEFKQLIKIIGNDNYETGIERIINRCSDTLKELPKEILFGLIFPNRKGIKEFYLFTIYRSLTPPPIIINISPSEKMQSILEGYDKIDIIEGEKISELSYHQRNSSRAKFDILKKVSISILGVGAIGSEIADCLAKAGIGRICLFDEQHIRAHNSVRHLAGLEYLDQLKVSAVSEILYSHNPFIKVQVNKFNLFDLDASEHMQDDTISISSVADDNVEGFINQQLVTSNKTAFYVRALRGGKVARIFRVIPGEDACFNCLSLYRKEKKNFIEIPDDLNYPTLKNECNNPIRPASASDLKLIASLTTRLLLDYLQTNDKASNSWIWSSEIIQNTIINEPFKLYQQHIPPHPDCAYCHHDEKISVFFNNSTLNNIKDIIRNSLNVETGGVLAGYRDGKGNIFITDASGPGPKAVQSGSRFEKDITFCQHFLDELYIQTNNRIVYVGEWHLHLSSNNNPSGTDLRSLSEISSQKEYLTEKPIMIIFSKDATPSCTVHPFSKLYYNATLNFFT
jgi:integrative and conjugative element protein (TIGR02256 family)